VRSLCTATWHALRTLRRLRFHAFLSLALFGAGLAGVVWAVLMTADADWYLFLGAAVSFAFSLIVIISYAESKAARGHPNPLILSKSCVDLLLAVLYMFEYAATQYAHPPIALPVRIAAVTQALLVCGEFWFFAMPIDMVQSITNPFTSYAHNIRVYWFYSVLSGAVCGLALWILDRSATEEKEDASVGRFFWFHENTDRPGFWWHHWLSYHLWVLGYLVFATVSVIYIKRRLKRGLEETFDVRRRVLSSGLLTCWIYITWSLVVLALFVVTNIPQVQEALEQELFEDLVNLSAFLHAARGGLNILVWLVINSSSLHAVCLRPVARSHRSGVSVSTSSSQSYPHPPAFLEGLQDDQDTDDEEEALVNKPELNTSLRRQMIQMATTGIIESVEHYHRLHRRVASNQTFHLDWQRSPQRTRSAMPRQLSVSTLSLSNVVANATIRVVEADGEGDDGTTNGLSSILPLRMREMQFYDFQPRVFASIRQIHGIQDIEYMYAFRHTMNERMSEGRSGAFVFTTSDRKYIVKSTTAPEKNVLLGLLPSYVRYLKWNPQSLLPKFFGFHAMKMYGQVFYFVVMGNVLNTNEVIHRRYDIKGSWVDRNAPACVLGERYRCSKCNRFFAFGVTSGPRSTPCEPIGSEHYPDITLRDNDLKKRIKLESDTALQLVKQLTRDSNFLASMGIMDYSLLVGTHYSHFTITSEKAKRRRDLQKEPSEMQALGEPRSPQDDEGKSLPSVQKRSPRDVGAESDDSNERLTPTGDKIEASGYVHNLCDEENDDTDGGTGLKHDVAAEASATTASASAEIASESRRNQHRYQAHQVSGPSTYYFGLVDILQKWTLSKKAERAYKVHVLRKARRGVSAVHPTAYAVRFQQKMHQLFMTTPSHLLHQSQSVLDGAPRAPLLPHDDDEEEDVGTPGAPRV
jgi:1-phosphatidylinositol-4-phosphate 5-kinase